MGYLQRDEPVVKARQATRVARIGRTVVIGAAVGFVWLWRARG
jgi:hypothetical protein